MKRRFLCLLLCLCMVIGMTATGCGKKNAGAGKPDAFVVMIDQPDGLFNPFFSTSAADGTVVSMTQISMLGATYNNAKKEVEVAYGENEAVVTKDYDKVVNPDGTITYTFVLKNGIKFSDGHPLTMEDVLFNYYVYLDPVYTGSNTLYSTDIVGLAEYRTQKYSVDDTGDDLITQQAATRAATRRNELINLFNMALKQSATKEVSYDAMKNAIIAHSVSSGYKSALSTDPSTVSSSNLLKDYEYALKLFKEELGTDYLAAQESYVDEPYKSHKEFKDEVFCFMYTEGYVETKYAEGADGKIDRTKIEKLTKGYPANLTSKSAAIEYVYNDKISRELDFILQYWATGNKVLDEYVAKAKEIILRENSGATGGLLIPNISGIVSLGHTDKAGQTITVNGTDYVIASGHNSNGTVTNTSEHDVLQITIKDVDPKAIWNFAISVAPQHYYGEGSSVGVDIANNKFGVEYASFDFMREVIQSQRNVKLPMGAGPYRVTDRKNSDKPNRNAFFADNVVYFKSNTNFHTVGANLKNAKIKKLRYQVVSSNDAIANLKKGAVHYISPAMTKENKQKLAKMKNAVALSDWQLGYGYIGVNASKVKDINLRKAIMYAMNTASALDYYNEGDADQIFWPMSRVSWAYPKEEDGSYNTSNGKGYPSRVFSKESAIESIQECMNAAGVSAGNSALKLKFTIAGASLQDHPTYKVFRDAAALLNGLGWQVEVVCDTQALTKISTGSLAVWAAAWGSALDPDMYQVYHKNSAATSTKAWGYDYLKNSGSSEELAILNELSDYIDDARATDDRAERTALYKLAMGKVLDLAVELPVYQRKVMYAFNSDVIKASSMPGSNEMNPYSSPLDRIWEVEFAK